MAIRFLRGQSITGTLSVSSTTTLAAATVSAPSTGDDSTRIPSTAWVKDQNYITSASLPTVNNSTITFTAGTGLTGGGTITLNQSSNETVTFNNSITNNNQLTNGAGYTTNTGTVTSVGISHGGNAFNVGSAVTTSGTLAVTMAGTSSQYINGAGNLTTFPSIPQGDITNVSTTSPITGGGSSGSVTIAHATSGATAGNYTNANITVNATGHVTSVSSGSDAQGVTSVATGDGLSGGTITSTGTLTVDSTVVRTTGTQSISGNKTFTSDINITSTYPRINLTDTNHNDDWSIINADGNFRVYNITDDVNSFNIDSSNNATFAGEIDVNGAVSSFGAGGTGDVDAVVSIDGGSGTNGEAYLRLTRGGTSGFILNHAASSLQVRATANIPMYFYTNDTVALTLNTSQNGIFAGNLTVSGGDITLGGTGRIQGIDTVSAGTDAANKTYVDNAVAGVPQGDITGVTAGSGLSGGGTSGTVTLTNSDKGSSQNIFKNIAVSGQSTVTADNNNDTLTLVASGGMTITTNASTDTITFNPNDDNDNYYVTSGSYSNGTLTLNRQGLSAVSVTGFPTDNDELSNGAGYITSASLPTVNNSTITFSAGTGLTGGGTITLNQSSNETVTFNASNNGTVTSVNFKTDGTALNVASNSITTSGTMTGVWQGSSSEYVNGEGDLVSFPSIPQGDITAVVAGTGMSGGGTSGSVTLNCTITNNNQLTNGAGYITASSSDTLTNKGGNISQWTNDSGYLTSAGSMSSWILKEGNGTETSTVTNGETVTFAQGAGIQTELTSTSSGGTLTISNTITNNNQLTNGAGYTTNTGTMTGFGVAAVVGGSSFTISNGETLSLVGGTNITATFNSSNESITFNNDITNNNQLTNGAGYITSGSLPTVNNATITLTAGTGLTGGGTITLNQSSNETVTFNATNNGTVTSSSGADNRVAVFTSATNIEGDSGFLYSGGQITASSIGVDDVFLTATAASSAGSAFCVIEATQIVTRTAAQVRSDIGAASSSSINNPTITFTAGTGLTGGGAITLNQSSNETVTFNNSITNNNQLTNGAGYTTNTGTVTGSGSSGRVAYWNSSSGITSDADLTFNGSSLTVGGTISSTQGKFQSSGEVVMSNASSSDTLLIGDAEETDGISQIQIVAAGTMQMEVDDGSIKASSNVDLLMQGGDVRLTGDTNINLDPSLSTNQTSGIVLPFGSGTVTGGKFYYWAGLSWSQTDADSENSSKGLIAYAKTSGSASANRMLLQGIIYKASHGFVLGVPLYLSTTQGDLQATAPSGTNDVARVVGYSLDANHIYFNPDNTWVKIA
tara:strand:+ start:3245 stop:7165 length:3921 start_codon:yes stop_codon:yes gene_type:complete